LGINNCDWSGVKTVFFSPFAGVWPNSKSEIELAESFKREGHDVLFIKCEMDYQDFCISMSSAGLYEYSETSDKLEACRRCMATREFIHKYFDFPSLNIFNNLTKSDHDFIDDQIAKLSNDNWQDYEFEGVRVGRISAYEFFLRHKITSYSIPSELWQYYLNQTRNSLLTLLGALRFFESRALDQAKSVDRVIVSNALYSSNRIFCEVAKRFNATTYSITQSGFLFEMDKFLDIQDPFQYTHRVYSPNWKIVSQIPLFKKEIERVERQINSQVEAKSFWTYSAPLQLAHRHELAQMLKLPSTGKIVLLAMSSSDEIFAAQMVSDFFSLDQLSQGSVFKDQFEWLTFVIESFRATPQNHLIIRPHPREFPNKRERGLSSQGQQIMEFFNKIQLPSNVSVNWPDQELSLYHLIPLVDALLIAWSSVAIEFASFGIPVIAYSNPYNLYPSELVTVASYNEELMEKLQQALRDGIQVKRSIIAFRWLNFLHVQSTVKLTPPGWRFTNSIFRIYRILYTRYRLPLPRFFIQLLVRLLRFMRTNKPSVAKKMILGQRNALEFTLPVGSVSFVQEQSDREAREIGRVISKLLKRISR